MSGLARGADLSLAYFVLWCGAARASSASFWGDYQKKLCERHPLADEGCVKYWPRDRSTWNRGYIFTYCEWQPSATMCRERKESKKKPVNPCKVGYSFTGRKGKHGGWCYDVTHNGAAYNPIKGGLGIHARPFLAPTVQPTYAVGAFQEHVCRRYPLAGKRCVKHWPRKRQSWSKKQRHRYCEWYPGVEWCGQMRLRNKKPAPPMENWRPTPPPTPPTPPPPTQAPTPLPTPPTPSPTCVPTPWPSSRDPLDNMLHAIGSQSSAAPTPPPTVSVTLVANFRDLLFARANWRDTSTAVPTAAPTPVPTPTNDMLSKLKRQHLKFFDPPATPLPTPKPTAKPTANPILTSKMRHIFNDQIFRNINAVGGGHASVDDVAPPMDTSVPDRSVLKEKLRATVMKLKKQALKRQMKKKVARMVQELRARMGQKRGDNNVVILDAGTFRGAEKQVLNRGPVLLGSENCWSLTAWAQTRHAGTIFSEAPSAKAKPGSRVIYISGMGLLAFALVTAGGSIDVVGTRKINDGAWHHIVVAYDCIGHTITLFVDGSEENRRKFSIGQDPMFPIRAGFGARGFPILHNFFRGEIQKLEFHRFTVTLSMAAAEFRYGRGTTSPTPATSTPAPVPPTPAPMTLSPLLTKLEDQIRQARARLHDHTEKSSTTSARTETSGISRSWGLQNAIATDDSVSASPHMHVHIMLNQDSLRERVDAVQRATGAGIPRQHPPRHVHVTVDNFLRDHRKSNAALQQKRSSRKKKASTSTLQRQQVVQRKQVRQQQAQQGKVKTLLDDPQLLRASVRESRDEPRTNSPTPLPAPVRLFNPEVDRIPLANLATTLGNTRAPTPSAKPPWLRAFDTKAKTVPRAPAPVRHAFAPTPDPNGISMGWLHSLSNAPDEPNESPDENSSVWNMREQFMAPTAVHARATPTAFTKQAQPSTAAMELHRRQQLPLERAPGGSAYFRQPFVQSSGGDERATPALAHFLAQEGINT